MENAIANQEASQPPRPEGAVDHFMEAVGGDRSAASFMVASLLHRELEEFGATGQHCSWHHHQLIDAVPMQAEWQWRQQQPTDMAPKVKIMPDGQAAIEFFTCRDMPPIALFRHMELYPAETYVSKSQNQVIATPIRSEAVAQAKVRRSQREE
ncbi:MAG: hypothetical protein HC781_08485 [Leptolyngbyaceae cyanobacterium CSU_1_4]|nr:hypothetical protein [Leptolyngbyaceae cyanobacterium CSU_1_4]